MVKKNATWGNVKKDSIKKEEYKQPLSVLSWDTFPHLVEMFGKDPLSKMISELWDSGDPKKKDTVKKVKAGKSEIYQIIDLDEGSKLGKYEPKLFYANSTCFNGIRSIMNKITKHGYVYDPVEGSEIEIEYIPHRSDPYQNQFIIRCMTNLSAGHDHRCELPEVNMNNVINIADGLYQQVLSAEAFHILIETGNVNQAKEEGGLINPYTGEAIEVNLAKEAKEKERRTLNFFKLKPGINRIRILPPPVDDGLVCMEIHQFYSVNDLPYKLGLKKKTFKKPEYYDSTEKTEPFSASKKRTDIVKNKKEENIKDETVNIKTSKSKIDSLKKRNTEIKTGSKKESTKDIIARLKNKKK